MANTKTLKSIFVGINNALVVKKGGVAKATTASERDFERALTVVSQIASNSRAAKNLKGATVLRALNPGALVERVFVALSLGVSPAAILLAAPDLTERAQWRAVAKSIYDAATAKSIDLNAAARCFGLTETCDRVVAADVGEAEQIAETVERNEAAETAVADARLDAKIEAIETFAPSAPVSRLAEQVDVVRAARKAARKAASAA
jgi:hypothetical protein